MDEFGVRFSVDDTGRFGSLRRLIESLKQDKETDQWRKFEDWIRLIPEEIKGQLLWPSDRMKDRLGTVRPLPVILIPDAARQIGTKWDLYYLIESIEMADYELIGCRQIDDRTAAIEIIPHGYPYGGVGPLIGLVEAFGFVVLGVNVYGRYEPRDDLLGAQKTDRAGPTQPPSGRGHSWVDRWLRRVRLKR